MLAYGDEIVNSNELLGCKGVWALMIGGELGSRGSFSSALQMSEKERKEKWDQRRG